MPFIFPRISIKINMAGIAQSMHQKIGFSAQPDDFYEILNTARDPSGQPYWKFVNDGTKVKYARAAGASLRGKAEESLPHRQTMMFWAGKLMKHRIVAGNPPVHMRERILPMIRKFWSASVVNIFRVRSKVANDQGGGQFTSKTGKYKLTYAKEYYKIGGVKYTGTKIYMKSASHISTPGTGTRASGGIGASQSDLWTSIMEDTMDYAIIQLEKITPILKPEYYSESYTTEPGTLKESYIWRRREGTYEPGNFSAIGKRLTVSRNPALARIMKERATKRLMRGYMRGGKRVGKTYQQAMDYLVKHGRAPKKVTH